MSSVRERAAAALFAAEQCTMAEALDLEGNWNRRLDDDDRDEYRNLTDAVLAVVADVEGLAGVLAKHQHLRNCWECSCGNCHTYQGEREQRQAALAHHQAEVIAAHLRGQS